MKVKRKNPLWIERLRLRYLRKGLEAAVGFPSGAGLDSPHYPVGDRRKKRETPLNPPVGGGPGILQVAVWNNFGTETIPRRAFMEEAARRMGPKFREMVREAVKALNSGQTSLDQVLKEAGAMGVQEVRGSILYGGWTPNAPSTARAKGSSRPLVDSGDLLENVRAEVRPRSG